MGRSEIVWLVFESHPMRFKEDHTDADDTNMKKKKKKMKKI